MSPNFFMFVDHTKLDTHMNLVGVPWTGDQLVAEATTYTAHKKHTDENLYPLRDFFFISTLFRTRLSSK